VPVGREAFSLSRSLVDADSFASDVEVLQRDFAAGLRRLPIIETTPDFAAGMRAGDSPAVTGHAAEVITHYAAAHRHDLVVAGYRGHFMGDVLLGSTADRVAHHAHCPVMVVR
jgi:nucleotide-binding universal stress UspA family protein